MRESLSACDVVYGRSRQSLSKYDWDGRSYATRTPGHKLSGGRTHKILKVVIQLGLTLKVSGFSTVLKNK